VASVDGTVIRESNDILSAIEAAFPERPLIPPPSEASHVRVRPLLQLERQLFGAWFNWLGQVRGSPAPNPTLTPNPNPNPEPEPEQGGSGHGAQLLNFEALLREVEAELEEGSRLGLGLATPNVNPNPNPNQVEAELEEGGGPYFLGAELSLVDCMFAPFLERMAASLPYYKAR